MLASIVNDYIKIDLATDSFRQFNNHAPQLRIRFGLATVLIRECSIGLVLSIWYPRLDLHLRGNRKIENQSTE